MLPSLKPKPNNTKSSMNEPNRGNSVLNPQNLKDEQVSSNQTPRTSHPQNSPKRVQNLCLHVTSSTRHLSSLPRYISLGKSMHSFCKTLRTKHSRSRKMEAIFLARRALFNIPKILPQRPACYSHSTTKISRSCFSTAFERDEGSNAVEESRGSGTNSSMLVREGMMEARQRVLDAPDEKPPGNTSSFAADTAKDGICKVTEMAENMGETAKGTLDGAWKAGREGLQGIRKAVSDDQIEEDPAVGEIENVEQPVDTQEYRGIEELKGKTGASLRAEDD